MLRFKNGFTLVELLVSLTVIAIMIALSVNVINYSTSQTNNISNELLAKYGEIESAFNTYMTEKGTTPTGLADSTFVPTYLFTPISIKGFDSSYGTTGFSLGQSTGKTSPNNGWYVCTKVVVEDSSDVKYSAVVKAASQLSAQKFFYNTSCPSLSNMAEPSGSATVYPTYWIMRN